MLFGAWILLYLLARHPSDALSLGLALAAAGLSLAFGLYALVRSPRQAR